MVQHQAVTKKLATAYRRGSRADKTKLLDQLVNLPVSTGTTLEAIISPA